MPLVHTAHTLAKVKNRMLAAGDAAEPMARVIGEEQVVAESDRLIANTPTEARELIDLYGATLDQVAVVEPGVDLDRFRPATGREAEARALARWRFGLPVDGHVVAFVGRIQPLKAPDVLLRAAAAAPRTRPDRGRAPDHRHRRRQQRIGSRPCRARRNRSASPTAYAFLPPQTRRGPGRPLPGRRRGRGAELQRILRPGRARGSGLRHAGRGGRGRRAGHGGPRRDLRCAGRRTSIRRLGAGAGRPAGRTRPASQTRRRARSSTPAATPGAVRRPACSRSTVKPCPSSVPASMPSSVACCNAIRSARSYDRRRCRGPVGHRGHPRRA